MQNKSNLNSKPVMQRADHVSVGQAAQRAVSISPGLEVGPTMTLFSAISPLHTLLQILCPYNVAFWPLAFARHGENHSCITYAAFSYDWAVIKAGWLSPVAIINRAATRARWQFLVIRWLLVSPGKAGGNALQITQL